MNITDLKDDIAAAVAQDATIKAWANTLYGKNHQVYIDADTRNLPGEAECPMIVFFSLTAEKHQDRRSKQYALGCMAAVYDATSAATDIGNLVRFNGPDRAEALRQLAEDAVKELYTDKFMGVKTEITAMEWFPLCVAEMIIFFKEPVTIGSDPLS